MTPMTQEQVKEVLSKIGHGDRVSVTFGNKEFNSTLQVTGTVQNTYGRDIILSYDDDTEYMLNPEFASPEIIKVEILR